jgi:CheY-like chemotaxis protein
LQQMTHLVDDLMEVSRITQGRVELRRRRLDLVEAMQDAVETCMPLMQASSHTLTVILPNAPVFVDGDPTRLAQIMLNLLNNAAKYTPPGGQIRFVGERQDDQAVLTVIDSGIGIPEQHLSSVFQMFSQLAPALERSQGGLGIGLALVRGLVELHGGTVCASSKGESLGSEFCVRLPVSQMEFEVLPASSDRPSAPTQRRRILLIDDNEDAIESMAMVLQMLGHEVRTARDGMTGIAVGREFSPQVVLLDIGLPELNGYDVAKLIRNEAWGSHAYLIAATGWGQREDKQAALDAGFDRHLTKPIDVADLDAVFRGLD